MIAFENLIVRSGDFTLRADFAIEPRGKIALLGASGAGKSTLLIALAGLMDIAAGRIIYDGQDITDLPPAQRPVSLLFQEHNLFAHLTVRQNIALGLRPDLRLSSADWAQVEGALTRVGLADYGTRLPRNYRADRRGGRPWHGRYYGANPCYVWTSRLPHLDQPYVMRCWIWWRRLWQRLGRLYCW